MDSLEYGKYCPRDENFIISRSTANMQRQWQTPAIWLIGLGLELMLGIGDIGIRLRALKDGIV